MYNAAADYVLSGKKANIAQLPWLFCENDRDNMYWKLFVTNFFLFYWLFIFFQELGISTEYVINIWLFERGGYQVLRCFFDRAS